MHKTGMEEGYQQSLQSERNIEMRYAPVPLRGSPEAPAGRRFPYFTTLITIANCLMYVYGIIFIITWRHANLSLSSPISPPLKQLYFYTVKWWPSCEDTRSDYWRLLSFQFIHASVTHLLGNSFGAFIYGALFEAHHPGGFLSTSIIYQLSNILGALGHSRLWPYRGLIGCSPGVYGLIGACWILIFCHRSRMDPFVSFLLPILLLCQLVGDVAIYLYYYNPSIGHSSHFFGFLTGLLLALAATIYRNGNNKLQTSLALAAVLAFLLESGYLCYHYYDVWPPNAYTQSYIHNVDMDNTCCAALFQYAESNDISVDQAKDATSCSNNQLYSDY